MNEMQCLSDAELLGVVVGVSGARKSLQGAGGSLARLLHESVAPYDVNPKVQTRLQAAKELIRRSLAESMRDRDAMTSPEAVRDYLRVSLSGRSREVFLVIFLDAQNRVLRAEELFQGTLTQTPVYPREIVRRALEVNAAAVILAHNHPSGVAEPSRADESLTQAVRTAAAVLDIKVLDHFIVAEGNVVSFVERGLM